MKFGDCFKCRLRALLYPEFSNKRKQTVYLCANCRMFSRRVSKFKKRLEAMT